MRCSICDRTLKDIVWNKDLRKWEICPTCMEIVHDALGKWADKSRPEEEEWDDTFRVPLEEYMKNPEKYGVADPGEGDQPLDTP